MKHLKSYKLFESIDVNIKSDIEDIVIELTDCEIYYEIADRKYWKNNTTSEEAVIIYLRDNQKRFFTLKDIEEVLFRLKDYLKDTDYSIDISIPDSDDFLSFDEFIKEFSGEELYHINIIIYYNPRISPFQRKYTAHEDFYENLKSIKKIQVANLIDINEFEDTINDILIDTEDCGLQVNYSRISKEIELDPNTYRNNIRTDIFLEVYITRPYGSQNRQIPGVVNPEGGYPGNLFFWYEIKDSIIRLTEWYFSHTIHEPIHKEIKYRWEKSISPLRFFANGIEMFIGFNKEKDFSEVGDFISYSNFRIELRF